MNENFIVKLKVQLQFTCSMIMHKVQIKVLPLLACLFMKNKMAHLVIICYY